MSWHCWRMMVTKWRVDGDKMRTTQEEMATNSSDFSSLLLVYMLFWVRNNVCSFFSHIRCTEPKISFKGFHICCCHNQKCWDFLFFPFFAVIFSLGLSHICKQKCLSFLFLAFFVAVMSKDVGTFVDVVNKTFISYQPFLIVFVFVS